MVMQPIKTSLLNMVWWNLSGAVKSQDWLMVIWLVKISESRCRRHSWSGPVSSRLGREGTVSLRWVVTFIFSQAEMESFWAVHDVGDAVGALVELGAVPRVSEQQPIWIKPAIVVVTSITKEQCHSGVFVSAAMLGGWERIVLVDSAVSQFFEKFG